MTTFCGPNWPVPIASILITGKINRIGTSHNTQLYF